MEILSQKSVSGGQFPEVEGGSFFARRRVVGAVRARAAGDEGVLDAEDAALLERYVTAQEVPAERFHALAEARAKATDSALADLGAPTGATGLKAVEVAEMPDVAIAFHPRSAIKGPES